MSLALVQEAVANYGAFAAIGAGLAAIGGGIGVGHGTSTRDARKTARFCNRIDCIYRGGSTFWCGSIFPCCRINNKQRRNGWLRLVLYFN